MLRAAPHRGPIRAVVGESPFVVGVQEGAGCHPFASVGVFADERMVAALSGCLYENDSIVTGERAAGRFALASAQGSSGVASLRGAFAAIACDRASGSVLTYRSPVGERPLFWREGPYGIAFASEVKQLLAVPGTEAVVDEEAVLDLLALRLGNPRRTVYRGVRRLPSGSTIARDPSGGTREERLWHPGSLVGRSSLSFGEAIAEFRRLLWRAVSRRLAADSAVFMSGGLDSTAVAAAAAPLFADRFGRRLRVVSAVYPDHPSADESRYAEAVVRALDLDPVWVRPAPRPFLGLEAEAELHDGPSIAPLGSNFALLVQGARREGTGSALDGMDGDSLFGDYGGGLTRALARRGAVRQIARLVANTRRRDRVGWARATASVGLALVGPRPLTAYRRVRRRPPDPTMLSPAPWTTGRLADRLVVERPEGWAAGQAAVYEGPLELLLETHERLALAHGLTLLHPLADLDLVELFLSLPPEVKFATGESKGLVRHGFPELPEAVRRRTVKTRFTDVVVAAAPAGDVLAAVRSTPRKLPGIDWECLEETVRTTGLSAPEVMLLVPVLQADRFLATAR
jgi:asparagine synthase (glutamine-hydrolysing)